MGCHRLLRLKAEGTAIPWGVGTSVACGRDGQNLLGTGT